MKAPRFLAISALAGGVLRLADNLLPTILDERGLQLSYLLTDVTLILGLTGFYFALRDRLGWLGLSGIMVAIIGLAIIRIGGIAGLHVYQFGAALTLFGTAFLGADMLVRKMPSRIAAILWLVALVVGLAALAPQIAMPAAFAAGIAFALAFILQGAVVLS